ncbi:DegQ family serine endoprotease [bacterium]|nr:DegQ family serine endoprotease [bacterium]
MAKSFRGISIALVAGSFLIIGMIIASQFSLTPVTQAKDQSLWTEGDSDSNSDRPGSFADLAQELSPAVVNISTTTVVKGPERGPGPNSPFSDEFLRRFAPGPQRPQKNNSLGSGFIINKEGYILTNNHVVDGADEIVVTLKEGDEYPAKIIGKDPKTDLALIKIEPKNGLPVIQLGDSDRTRVGDWVLAIGNPFGLGHTVTAGIVSAKGRALGTGPYDDFIQTDTAINPGNSGGPLLDMGGNVIGINSVIFTRSGGSQGVGFAIPENLAKSIVAQLKESGSVTRAWLGVMIQQITPELQESLELETRKGALVGDVFKGSPASKAGLLRGDVIVRFNGEEVSSQRELPAMVAFLPVGQKVEVVFLRSGKEMAVEVTLDELKKETTVAKESSGEVQEGLGLSVQNITPEIAEQLGLTSTAGVVVSDVDQSGMAAQAGIRRGDVILEVNRTKVTDFETLNRVLEKDKDSKSTLFLISRGGTTVFIAVSK